MTDPKPLGTMPFADMLGAIAAKTPAPGGGAAASAVGALGAALARMVGAYSVGKKSLAEHQPMLLDADARLERAAAMFLRLADEDAEAYARVNALQRLAPEDPDRKAGWSDAVDAAVMVPRASLAAGIEVLRLLESLVGRTNTYLASDLAVAAVLAEAACRSAAWNVRVNLPLLDEGASGRRGEIEADVARSVADASAICARIEAGCEHA